MFPRPVVFGMIVLTAQAMLLAPSVAEAQDDGSARPTKNLAVGGSFEQWVDGTVSMWKLYGAGKIEQTVDARLGHFAVRLLGDSGQQNVTLQYIFRLPEGIDGKTLKISILAKTRGRGLAALNLRWDFGNGEKTRTRSHPGDGEWSRLVHEVELPSNVNSSLLQIRCIVLLRRSVEISAVFDDFIIEVTNREAL